MSKVYVWVSLLSSFGIILSSFLLWEQIYQPSFQPCTINETVNCDAVISGPVAYTFGIRTPLYGLIGYCVMLVTSLMKWKKTIFWVSSGGLLFCLYIAYIELFQLRVICPVCVLCQMTMVSIWLLSYRLKSSDRSSPA